MNINQIILDEIEALGIKKFAADWGLKENAVKMVQRTKKPSAAMLTKAFEMMQPDGADGQAQQAPVEPVPPPFVPTTGPVTQPFRRTAGVAPMFTDQTGMDQPISSVRPASPRSVGAPFVVPPQQTTPGTVPARHPGIALGPIALHAPQVGMIVPPGIDPQIWGMFQQFLAMMGMAAPAPQVIDLPGGQLSMPQNFGINWNVPHGYKLVRADDEPEQTRAPRPRRKLVRKT